MVIEEKVSLARKTSYKIGGSSRYYTLPQNVDELKESISWANDENLEIFILGKGSNVLVSDKGWPGITIDISELKSISWEGNNVNCGAGALLHNLVMQSVERGYHGMEALAGIPGSIGGGIVMNAGAFGANISDVFVDATILNYKTCEITTLKKDEFQFGYRTSILKREPLIVIEALFNFSSNCDKKKVRELFTEILEKRKGKQPLELPNCGSVFKRPEGNYAGTLIESCGLKGFRVGGATVSNKHANFIVNENSASAEDVKKVIEHVQETVLKEKNISLETEVIFIGDFED